MMSLQMRFRCFGVRKTIWQYFPLSRRICHVYLDLDFLGRCRNGSSSPIIDRAQYFLEQASGNGNLGQSKCGA